MGLIKPGGMGSSSDASKPAEFAGSMAEAIEDALNELLADESPKMKTFDVNTNSREARDRRRLFVAITLGMMRYLQNNMDGFEILDPAKIPTKESIVMNTDPTTL